MVSLVVAAPLAVSVALVVVKAVSLKVIAVVSSSAEQCQPCPAVGKLAMTGLHEVAPAVKLPASAPPVAVGVPHADTVKTVPVEIRGIEQFAFPEAAIPVAYCPVAHWVGVVARAVAVAAFPLVFEVIVAGRSAAVRRPHAGAPAIVFAPGSAEPAINPLVGSTHAVPRAIVLVFCFVSVPVVVDT